MNLYIWNNPYHVTYGGTCLYALASNLREARHIALNSVIAVHGSTHAKKKIFMDKLGKPSRIISKPYAEVYEWSE